MNKAELIDAMAADAGITKADAKKALESFIGATTDALKKGDRVALVGFGTFGVSKGNLAIKVVEPVSFPTRHGIDEYRES